MQPLIYTVHADCASEEVCEAFIRWLVDTHAAQVVAAGAESAEIVLLDHGSESPGRAVEVRYRFRNRAVFERYIEESAPALRQEGLALFPPHRGVSMSRRIGELESFVS